MKSFIYDNPTRLVFGEDSVEELPNQVSSDHKKILLHYGGGSIIKSGLYHKIIDILNKMNIEVVELGGVKPNPTLQLVYKGVKICKDMGISLILAVGGGSVIDSAKAIAAGALYDGDIWDCFIGKGNFNKALPLGVVLTIPATGSETSPNAIITNEDGLLKRGIDHLCLRPKFAIMNPQLTLTLSHKHTFAGIVDIISHIHERYFTNTENTDLTDSLCEATYRTVITNAYYLKEDLNDIHARSEIMLSGSLAHCGILGMGREEDWGSHRIGHEISGLYGTTHGITLSIILPAWMKYVYKDNLYRFARFANSVFSISCKGRTLEEVALEGIRSFETFLKDINMPTSFTEYGLATDDFELLAEKCVKDSYVGNFKKLYYEDVLNILNLAK